MSDDDWETAADVSIKKPIKSSWDEEEEEEEAPPQKTEEQKKEEALIASKKKALKDKIREKEEAEKRAELELKAAQIDPRATTKRRVEESDFENAQDLFDSGRPAEKTGSSFESRKPKKKEEFEEYAQYIAKHLRQFEKSMFYTPFVRSLTRELCLTMKGEDVKEVQTIITVLANDKLKEKSNSKGKKKVVSKAAAVVERDELKPHGHGFGADIDDDFGDDDFM